MSMSDAIAFEEWQRLSPNARKKLLRQAKRDKNKKRFNLALGAMMGSPWAIAGIGQSALGHAYKGNYVPYQQQYQFQKDDRPMPRKDIVRRKKKQIRYTEGMAATGLGGAALVGAGAGAKKLVPFAPKSKIIAGAAKHSTTLKGAGGALFGGGAVVGGLSNLNNAAIQRDDLKRHYASELKKGDNIIKVYDPEKNRTRRQKAYTPALIGSGAAVASISPKVAPKIGSKIHASRETNWRKKYNADIAHNATHNAEYARYQSERSKWTKDFKAAAKHRVKANREYDKDPKIHQERINYYENRYQHLGNNQPKPPTSKLRKIPKMGSKASYIKNTKRAGFVAGAALAGLGVANEYHRKHGGKPYE